ncbi:MAG: hydroxymethylpyrimidine/phosphomethylpyrimidine kinase, partial [Lachnospiraceae bacterium]|nr:hydroxymethylpyrimidine/phosphomethylpyrimidine kinase [Lachnospiraceae bacterium]
LDAVFQDIRPDAVKIGMVPSPEMVEVIAECLRRYKAGNVVVDPVMVATSGAQLSKDSAISRIRDELFPLATVITPNIPETEALSGKRIRTASDMEQAARYLGETFGTAVLCKGGHRIMDANDLLYQCDRKKKREEPVAGQTGNQMVHRVEAEKICQTAEQTGSFTWFYGERIENPNTHGTGCTLSSAIASNLAKGQSLEEAIRNAKAYLSRDLAAMLDLGEGSGPLNHMA